MVSQGQTINRKYFILLLICLYTLANTHIALCATQQVTVTGDGTGDYKCDGKGDQEQINQALSYAASHPGTTVYLKGPFVYDINNSVLIGSNTELTGDSNAILRLADKVGWTTASKGTPMIGQIGGYGSAVHDISIHGFELDGNEANNDASSLRNNGGGKDPYRMIAFQGSSSSSKVKNIKVYNMNIHDSKGDGFRIKYGTNISCYNNKIANTQHCCVYYQFVNTGRITDNIEYCLCCSGDRTENCQDITIDRETINPFSGSTHYPKDKYGFAYDDNAIQIGDGTTSSLTKNIIVRNCSVKGGVNGIYVGEMSNGCNVNVYNNAIHDSGYENEGVTRNGGIGITHPGNGIIIQNNDINNSYVAGINVDSAASGTHTVTIKNNNIMNGKSGYAVKNSVASQVSLILNHNYITGYQTKFYPSSLTNTNPATSPNGRI